MGKKKAKKVKCQGCEKEVDLDHETFVSHVFYPFIGKKPVPDINTKLTFETRDVLCFNCFEEKCFLALSTQLKSERRARKRR